MKSHSTRQWLRTGLQWLMASRRNLVLAMLAVAAGGILSRAVFLQLVHKDFLQDQGDERYLRVVEVPTHRGMIVDRNGQPLAVSSPVDSVWADPKLLSQHLDRLPVLARLLSMKPADLEQKLNGRENRQFVYLRRHLTPSEAKRVMAQEIPGVYLQREYRRYYPTGEVTSHLLGFTNVDDMGQEGLEVTFDQWLQGKPGSKRVLKDRLDRFVEDVESIREPEPGNQLTLSIDQRIQYLTYRALKAAYMEHRADGAFAVVVDVPTGEILAMVNQPAANPNNRKEIKPELLRNRAATDLFEPGSTGKPFTIAMALESGAYKPTTPINTAPGYLQVGSNRVRDVHNYGLIDVSRVLSKSSNVGTSKIALSLPAQKLWNLLIRLGFGAPTGVGFNGEQRGVLTRYSSWGAIGHANHSFGYGYSVTGLQLAQAYTVLAADGIRRPLSIVHRDQSPAQEERVLAADAVRKVRVMLEAAVSREGTGFKASVPGYQVAGKTGTARKVVNGHYSTRNYVSLFAGMAPASRPRLVMVVVIDNPRGGAYYGGAVAAPVFGKVMSGALRILNVTPDALPRPNYVMAGGTP